MKEDMIKDTDEWPEEEIHRVWKGPKCRNFCPCGVRVATLQGGSPELFESHTYKIFMKTSLYRHD